MPESGVEALRAARDAEADAAMHEPGESIPWEQVKAELDLQGRLTWPRLHHRCPAQRPPLAAAARAPLCQAVAQVIDGLATDPRPPGFLPLTDHWPFLRVRSGDYRAIYARGRPGPHGHDRGGRAPPQGVPKPGPVGPRRESSQAPRGVALLWFSGFQDPYRNPADLHR